MIRMAKAKGKRSQTYGFDSFLSVFTWRYGSDVMRRVFSEVNYRAKWREIWTALAEAELRYGLLTAKEFADIRKYSAAEYIDIDKSHQVEKVIGHDLMAEIRVFVGQAKVGGGKIHLGATSADIEDNADILRMREALGIIRGRLVSCLSLLGEKIQRYKSTACMGWTHLQPAEPTTIGYRFATYAQDLILDVSGIDFLLERIALGKGMKGAVGTAASYSRLIGVDQSRDLEKEVMKRLDLKAFPITTQTYPRKVDFLILTVLAAIAQSIQKFALDMRILQSPPFGEVSEPFERRQVGSSAMPFKRNPVLAERASSLGRYASSVVAVALTNASSSMLERTLDDSANRRIIIPESFLAVDECLLLYSKIISGMKIMMKSVERNLERYGSFSLLEPLMMDLVKRGEDRQQVHERFRRISRRAWTEVERGMSNPLERLLTKDTKIREIYGNSFSGMLDPSEYIGDAISRTDDFLRDSIRPLVGKRTSKKGSSRGRS